MFHHVMALWRLCAAGPYFFFSMGSDKTSLRFPAVTAVRRIPRRESRAEKALTYIKLYAII